jgi:hypothetical protein
LPGEVGGLLIQIDPARERFLADHVVGDTPLLPTVMALDLLVRAASARRPPATSVVVHDLEVGPPILVANATPLGLQVTVDEPATSGRRLCEIVATETGAVHYRAVIESGGGRTRSVLVGPAWPTRLPVPPDMVYPPFFHGPTFQVVGGLGQVADGVVALMADELPGLWWSSGNLQIRPRLLELFMQGCGLHAFAASGRMMIPSRIDLMTWYAAGLRSVARAAEEPAVAHISPRISMANDEPDTANYDGLVVAADGQVLLTVEGYHAVDLGVPRDVEHARALRARLDDDLIPAMSTTDVLPQPQGVRP